MADLSAELLPVLREHGYRRPIARQPGWFDRDCPDGGFVRFTFEDDGTATATRMDYQGFRMTPVTTFPAGTPANEILSVLEKMEG